MLLCRHRQRLKTRGGELVLSVFSNKVIGAKCAGEMFFVGGSKEFQATYKSRCVLNYLYGDMDAKFLCIRGIRSDRPGLYSGKTSYQSTRFGFGTAPIPR